MKPYTKKTARIKAWRNRLSKVETKRPLRETLLGKLPDEFSDNPNLARFNKKRRKLLSEAHEQDFFWMPHFNWLWDLLSYFLPKSWLPQHSGSRLYDALKEELQVFPFYSLDKDALESIAHLRKLISEEEYEQALYENPSKALADLNFRMKDLDQENFETLFDRLYAIKPLLHPLVYQGFLERLYHVNPLEALSFFYKQYQENQQTSPKPHDFIEQHMMARAMIDCYVKPNDNDKEIPSFERLSNHMHAIQYLLILLSLRDCKEPIDLLSRVFDGHNPDDVFTEHLIEINVVISNSIPENEKNKKGRSLIRSPSKARDSSDEEENTPRRLLEDIFKYLKPQNTDNPLLLHFASFACEQLLMDFRATSQDESCNATWNDNHEGYKTLEWIIKTILKTLESKKPLLLNDNKLETHADLINPATCKPGIIPSAFSLETAESFARKIVLESAPLKGGTPNHLALKYAADIRTQIMPHLTQDTLDWIYVRVRHINPNLIPALKHVLNDVDIYIKAPQPVEQLDASPLNIISQLHLALQKAQTARKELDAKTENASAKILIESFAALLHHPKLNSIFLEEADSILSQFHEHYITWDLHQHWRDLISKKQEQLCTWNQKKLENSSNSYSAVPLCKIEKCMGKALREGFAKQYQLREQALCSFKNFIKKIADANTGELTIARDILPNLERYLEPELHNQWKRAIRERLPTLAIDTSNRFFKSSVQESEERSPYIEETLGLL